MRAPLATPLLRREFSKCVYCPQQTRSFQLPPLSSFTSSTASPVARTLSESRTLPYPPRPLFRTIAAVEEYGDFLPFLTSSTVTAHDRVTGYPTRAYLTVGYGPLSETFLSKVDCNEANWTVGATSGERALRGEAGVKDREGIFEYLDTIWKLAPVGAEITRVDLTVNFKFRSAIHAAMMGSVEGQVAGTMIEAFEERVRSVHGVKHGGGS